MVIRLIRYRHPLVRGQVGSSFSVDDDSGSHALLLAPTPSCLREFGTSSYVDYDLQDVDNMNNIPPLAHTPSCLREFGTSSYVDYDLQDVDNMNNIPPLAHTPSCVTQFGLFFWY